MRLANEPAPENVPPVPQAMEFESKIAEQELDTQEFRKTVDQIGTRTSYTCPACNGSIWQIGNEEPLRFRCHIGHSFTAEPFQAEQSSHIENLLWSVVRSLEAKVTLVRQMAERMKDRGSHKQAVKYEEYARNVDGEVAIVRELILRGFATKRTIPMDEE